MPSLEMTETPCDLADDSMLRARPAPYTSLSLAIATLVQPSSFMVVASAAPWMVSFGTMRAYVRLPVG